MNALGYSDVCAAHSWSVPERYNIAADVCDKHPQEKLAMVWESYDGSARELTWGEMQDLANQAAHTLAGHGVEHAEELARVLDAGAFKVNLIPYNPTGSDYKGSGRETIARFKVILDRAGIPSTVRLTRGRDIAAACGQLAAAPRAAAPV